MEKIGNWIIAVVVVVALLWFTPLGGIVNALVRIAGFGGALALIGWALFDLLEWFPDYRDLSLWKGIVLKALGAVLLVLTATLVTTVLPPPPPMNTSDCYIERGIGGLRDHC